MAGPAAAGPPTITGGVGDQDFGGTTNIRASVLAVDGKLSLSTPDNAWAVDARDGTVLWHYYWRTKGGTHIGNRGLGMWGKWLDMEAPDNYLVCLDAETGKEPWHKPIADFNRQYFSTMAPIVIGNKIIVGTGNDLDAPGYVKVRDPETGEVLWTWWSVPTKKGDPGLETWGSLEGAKHGAGNVWIPGAYDPDTNLYFWYGKPIARVYESAEPRWGELVHVFDCGAGYGDGEDEVVLPDEPARYA